MSEQNNKAVPFMVAMDLKMNKTQTKQSRRFTAPPPNTTKIIQQKNEKKKKLIKVTKHMQKFTQKCPEVLNDLNDEISYQLYSKWYQEGEKSYNILQKPDFKIQLNAIKYKQKSQPLVRKTMNVNQLPRSR